LSQERREAILAAREANKKLAELITKGTSYHEPVEVKGIDNELHKFEVSPMSDADLSELLESTNVDLKDIGNKDKMASNLQFLQKGAAIVTGVPDVAKALMPMESLKLILKSFELSGLTGIPKPA
jgi:arsenate reductase-like glutaredoxin family protein